MNQSANENAHTPPLTRSHAGSRQCHTGPLDKSMELAAQCLAKYQAVILESKLVHSTCFAEQSYSDSQ
jgi:hypothetical protein